MKKILSVILCVAAILSFGAVANAAVGDVAGRIYSTDIRAFINGVEVPSYCTDGKTVFAIEEVLAEKHHRYFYDDTTRTLKFFSLAPWYLTEGKSTQKDVPGRVVGNIYETDIKTSVYDVVVPSYAINGKTVVAIEDLGYDKEFSPIGGRYVWDENNRTISLEFLYPKVPELSRDKNMNITLNDDLTEGVATFEEGFHCDGGAEHIDFPESASDLSKIEAVIPIKADGEIIGYYLHRPSETNQFTAFTQYYPEKVKEAEKNYVPAPKKTKEEIIEHFLTRHSSGGGERFDGEGYSFVYISVAGTSWTAYNLLQAYDDGTYIDYSDIIRTQSTTNRSPKNLVIDEENEKVTFRFSDRYTAEWYSDYEIDLKKGEIYEVK